MDNPILSNFEVRVTRDFSSSESPSSSYSLSLVSKHSATKVTASTSTSPVSESYFTIRLRPMFGQQWNQTPTKPHFSTSILNSVSSWKSTAGILNMPLSSYSNNKHNHLEIRDFISYVIYKC